VVLKFIEYSFKFMTIDSKYSGLLYYSKLERTIYTIITEIYVRKNTMFANELVIIINVT